MHSNDCCCAGRQRDKDTAGCSEWEEWTAAGSVCFYHFDDMFMYSMVVQLQHMYTVWSSKQFRDELFALATPSQRLCLTGLLYILLAFHLFLIGATNSVVSSFRKCATQALAFAICCHLPLTLNLRVPLGSEMHPHILDLGIKRTTLC